MTNTFQAGRASSQGPCPGEHRSGMQRRPLAEKFVGYSQNESGQCPLRRRAVEVNHCSSLEAKQRRASTARTTTTTRGERCSPSTAARCCGKSLVQDASSDAVAQLQRTLVQRTVPQARFSALMVTRANPARRAARSLGSPPATEAARLTESAACALLQLTHRSKLALPYRVRPSVMSVAFALLSPSTPHPTAAMC